MLPISVNTPQQPHLSAVPGDIDAACRGDERAFERLYRANAGRVYALSLRLTGNKQRAEDLVQSAFIRAWKGLKGFRGDSSFSTWLHRLTVNTFLLDDRGDRRRALRELSDDSADEMAVSSPQRSVDIESRIDLERAIALLPEGARVAFVLYDIYGYTHDEIGGMTGIATGTVRAQLHRARRRLKEILER